MAYETLLTDLQDGVLTVTLNRPDKLNAFNQTMSHELIDFFTSANTNDEIRAIVITGAGRAFCAGADISGGSEAFKVEKFVEKPNLERAVEYLQSGEYRWNAGMFLWSFVTITQGLEKHQPEMAAACQRWFQAAQKPGKLARVLAREYPEIKKISIDYALMEQAQNVVCADGAFEWDDLGAWPALARHLKPDAEGNCSVGDFLHVDSARNIVYDARTRNRSPIAVVGVRDAIIVLTDDSTLVAQKGQAQKIKEIVGRLAADKRLRHLV